MIKKIYAWLYKNTARADEKGEYSGGRIQGSIRAVALEMCMDIAGKTLEIGTGAGMFLVKLALQNPRSEIWGIDTSKERLEELGRKIEDKNISNVHLMCRDALSTGFSDGTFDTVICINFFVDADKPLIVNVLKEMKRVLKPSGKMIFEFRNSRNIIYRLKYALARYYDPSAPFPLYTYYPEEIDRIMADLGIKVIRKVYPRALINYTAPIIMIEAQKI